MRVRPHADITHARHGPYHGAHRSPTCIAEANFQSCKGGWLGVTRRYSCAFAPYSNSESLYTNQLLGHLLDAGTDATFDTLASYISHLLRFTPAPPHQRARHPGKARPLVFVPRELAAKRGRSAMVG